MKNFLARFFLASLLALAARAALPTGLIWELRSGGNASNGGGFNPANANFMTDLTVAAGEGANAAPHVSSATYTFVAGDVGAWVYAKTGTGWNASVFYKISSVAGGIAVLDATTGHGLALGGQAGGWTFNVTTVQGIGVATPGGNATFGVDYSQQDAQLLTRADLSCTSNASTTLTSATGGTFTKAMAGNLIHLTTQGTGNFGIIGWYEIVSDTDGTNVVLDVTPCNSASALAAGTGQVGGGILSLGAIGSATARLGAVPGNTIFITQGGGATFSNGAQVFACNGTQANPIVITGYGTFRGDGYLGRNTTGDGTLITTNMPGFGSSGGNDLSFASSAFVIVRNLRVFGAAGAATGQISAVGAQFVLMNCSVTCQSTASTASGINTGASAEFLLYDNDVFMTGASGGSLSGGIAGGTTTQRWVGNRVQMSQSSSTGPGLKLSGGVALRNTVIGNGGTIGIFLASVGVPSFVDSNTVVGFVDGINTITATTVVNIILNNLITDNSANAINNTTSGIAVFNANNRLRGVTTIANGTNYTNASSIRNVTTAGAAYSDYVNQPGGDFRLIAGSPAIGAAVPAAASMGALQKAATSAVQTSYGSAQ